jgi:hypothetical protein
MPLTKNSAAGAGSDTQTFVGAIADPMLPNPHYCWFRRADAMRGISVSATAHEAALTLAGNLFPPVGSVVAAG